MVATTDLSLKSRKRLKGLNFAFGHSVAESQCHGFVYCVFWVKAL